MTSPPKPPFRAPRREGDTMVGRGNTGWNVKEWMFLSMPELLTMVSHRKDFKEISAESSLKSPRMTQLVKGMN